MCASLIFLGWYVAFAPLRVTTTVKTPWDLLHWFCLGLIFYFPVAVSMTISCLFQKGRVAAGRGLAGTTRVNWGIDAASLITLHWSQVLGLCSPSVPNPNHYGKNLFEWGHKPGLADLCSPSSSYEFSRTSNLSYGDGRRILASV